MSQITDTPGCYYSGKIYVFDGMNSNNDKDVDPGAEATNISHEYLFLRIIQELP